jgi:hypothetical protein
MVFLFAPVKAPATVRGRYICLCCDFSTAFQKRFVLTAQKRRSEDRRYAFGASLAGGAAGTAGAAGA